jgi:hypothetical protein
VATGQDTTLDPVLVQACIKIVGPQAETLAASGMFGPAIPVPDHSVPQSRLLAMLGRSF